jgi:hypothetical protein
LEDRVLEFIEEYPEGVEVSDMEEPLGYLVDIRK